MNVSSRIELAWEAKINLDYERCLQILAQVKVELRIPPGELSQSQVESLLAGKDAEVVQDVLLLSASLGRALGNGTQSGALIRRVEDYFSSREQRPGFRLYYEKGMGAFLLGDFNLAMEEFLRASYLATRPVHRLWSLGNALFCMENLGLPYDRTLAQVRSLQQEAKGDPSIARVEGQFHAFELRASFRNGRFRELLDREEARPQDLLDQGKCFSYWVRQLPYHAFHRPLAENELELFATPQSTLHHPFFKLRTLQGVLHPEDLTIGKPSEVVDRVYLWVWFWLQNPNHFNIQKTLMVLRNLELPTLWHRLTVEDAQLLKNALSWLALFTPGLSKDLKDVLALTGGPRSQREFPLFKLESHVVEYLLALKNEEEAVAQDFRTTLERHPLWRSKELRFRQLVESVTHRAAAPPKELTALVQALRTVLKLDLPRSGASLIIDPERGEITKVSSGKRSLSEPIVRALTLLKREGTVSAEVFLNACFGIRKFDPAIHSGKIFNLFTRIRALTGPTLRLHLKAEKVQAEGDLDSIWIRETAMAVDLAPLLTQWKLGLGTGRIPGESVPQPRPPVTVETIRAWNWEGGLVRAEIEQLLETPRSTTNRILEKWVKQGVLLTQGRARTTKYFLAKGNGMDHRRLQ